MAFGEIIEIVLIGFGLSMDAMAISLCDALAYPDMRRSRKLTAASTFAVFQGMMPVLGYFVGSLFSDFVTRYAGIITLLILGVIGANMIRESFSGCPAKKGATLSVGTIMAQAVATSIDAFAVGVSFLAEGASIAVAAPVSAIATLMCCLFALFLGKKLGTRLGSKAQIVGGVVLILVGIKAVL